MVIKAIESIRKVSNNDVVISNEIRRELILEVINNGTNVLFQNLYLELKNKEYNKAKEIIEDELFFEQVNSNTMKNLIEGFVNTNNKENFINNLEKSYVKKGIKGIAFSWFPIILGKVA